MRCLTPLTLFLLVLSAAGCRHGDGANYQTAVVTKGNISAAVSASGTLQPEEVIDVGAQVAGRIRAFGTDQTGKPIDFGSHVAQGDVLAHIDDSLYAADVAQSQSKLIAAEAGVAEAEADVLQLRAKLDQAQRDWDRAQKLGPGSVFTQSGYDQYRATFAAAKAGVAVAEAAVARAHATVEQSKAELSRAQQQLDYCVIHSPVDGVIIDRRVNIGQTVVSSLNAPSLFLIAKDLRRMVVWASVNEADIGNIHPGQSASFTVDAFPGAIFPGAVRKIRLNAAMTQNVVTYIVEVTTENTEGKLIPYLTANVSFDIGHKEQVLLVPNAALRFSPAGEPISDSPGLWLQASGALRRVPVRVGLTNGTLSEIEGEIEEGSEVITSASLPDDGARSQQNMPFTPQLRRRTRS